MCVLFFVFFWFFGLFVVVKCVCVCARAQRHILSITHDLLGKSRSTCIKEKWRSTFDPAPRRGDLISRQWSGRTGSWPPNEPVEFEKQPVEVQDWRKITDHFRGIYRIYPNFINENWRMWTGYAQKSPRSLFPEGWFGGRINFTSTPTNTHSHKLGLRCHLVIRNPKLSILHEMVFVGHGWYNAPKSHMHVLWQNCSAPCRSRKVLGHIT